MSMDFCPNKPLLASTDGDSVIIWDTNTGTQSFTARQSHRMQTDTYLSFSPNGLLAFTVWDQDTEIWDVENQILVARLSTKGASPQIWCPDGTLFAIADSTVVIWNIAEQSIYREFQYSYPMDMYSLAWSPDGKMLALGGSMYNPEILVWDVEHSNIIANQKLDCGHIQKMVFQSNGTIIYATDYGRIESWNIHSNKTELEFDAKNHQSYRWQVYYGSPEDVTGLSLDAKIVAYVQETGYSDEVSTKNNTFITKSGIAIPEGFILHVVELETSETKFMAEMPNESLTATVFNHNNTLLATGDLSGEIHLWKLI